MAKGDQIYALREFLNQEGLYQHHGIDCGDGTVIHYRKPSETIERTSLAIFARGNPVYHKNYPTAFIPDTVVRRAESRLGEKKAIATFFLLSLHGNFNNKLGSLS